MRIMINADKSTQNSSPAYMLPFPDEIGEALISLRNNDAISTSAIFSTHIQLLVLHGLHSRGHDPFAELL